MSYASVRSISFLSFIGAHLCMNCSLDSSNFLQEISSLSHSIVFLLYCLSFPFYCFPLFLLYCLSLGLLISLHWSLRKAFVSLLAILWNSAFKWIYLSFSPLPLASFFSQLFLRPHQIAILPFCLSFSWGWSWSLCLVQCHEPLSIVLQALGLSNLTPWIYLSLLLYNHKGFDLGLTWMV